jgi:DNA-binding response OmpR family regulator
VNPAGVEFEGAFSIVAVILRDVVGQVRICRLKGMFSGSTRRLLVVDDEPDFAQLVREVGERNDFVVETLSKSRNFEEAYRRFEPSIIVLDIVMPDVDGIEIIQWLAANDSTAAVILATGYNPDFAKAAEALGSIDGRFPITSLAKPISLVDLKAALEAQS